MFKALKWLALSILLLTVLIVVLYYSSDEFRQEFNKGLSQNYETSFKQSFLESCSKGNAALLPQCTCILTELEKRGLITSPTDMYNFSETAAGQKIINECAQHNLEK